MWHHCHVYRHLHNVTQSLPFGKILRIMETESKQSCVLVYRYTKGITIVLPFFRSLCLAVLYCWVFCIGSSVRRRPTTGPVREDTIRRDRVWMYSPLPFSSKMTFLYRIHVFNDDFLLLPAILQSSFHLCRSHCRSHSFCGFSYVTHHASEKRYEVGRFNFLRQTLSLVSLALRNSLEPAVSTWVVCLLLLLFISIFFPFLQASHPPQRVSLPALNALTTREPGSERALRDQSEICVNMTKIPVHVGQK